jgi:DNA-binding transcriptional LysR family regulator
VAANRTKIDSIEDLDIFVRIVESGTMTAAGLSLGMSTPMVSRRLATLERNLGVRLVDRTSRMLVLTEQGREFHARAESLLQQVHDAEAALHAQAGELRGTLRISVPTAAAETGVVADFVALFHKHTSLSLEMRLSDRPVDVVASGLDAALYLTDAPDRHPGDLVIGQHPTSLCAAPAYLRRAGVPSSPDALAQHRTVRAVSRRGTPTCWTLMSTDGRECKVPPSGAMFLSDDLRVLYTATINGAGIGRMPVGYIARAASAGELEVVLPQWRFRPIMIAATLRRRGAMTAKIAALLELTRITLQRIDALAIASPLEQYFREQVALTDPAHPTAATPATPSIATEPA